MKRCLILVNPAQDCLKNWNLSRDGEILQQMNSAGEEDCLSEHAMHKNSPEHYQLYERYIQERHSDGDMFPPSRDQYKNFLVYPAKYSYFLEIRDNGRLVACCVTDALDDGLSAIYTYFDTSYVKFSLGTLSVLLLCRMAKEMTLPYVYLGYWVKNSQKMHYKAQFKPLEIFNGEIWHSLPEQV